MDEVQLKEEHISKKSILKAAIVCACVGILGIHYFYAGQRDSGIKKIYVSFLSLLSIILFVLYQHAWVTIVIILEVCACVLIVDVDC